MAKACGALLSVALLTAAAQAAPAPVYQTYVVVDQTVVAAVIWSWVGEFSVDGSILVSQGISPNMAVISGDADLSHYVTSRPRFKADKKLTGVARQ